MLMSFVFVFANAKKDSEDCKIVYNAGADFVAQMLVLAECVKIDVLTDAFITIFKVEKGCEISKKEAADRIGATFFDKYGEYFFTVDDMIKGRK